MNYQDLDLDYLKSIYESIFQIEVLDHVFVFRALGREEYREIMDQQMDLGSFQEAICFTGNIFPNDYDFTEGIAGVAELLADLILDASGLHGKQGKEILDEHRMEMENFDFQVDCMIHEAFPEFSLEEIATWPLRKSLFYLSRAEWILTNLRGVSIIPFEELERQEEQQAQPPQPEATPEESVSFVKEKGNDFSEAPQLSEAQVMAMLQQEANAKGQSIGNPKTNMNDMFPELNWFKHEEELTGEFD